jgi:hypothetical protein
MNFWKNFKVLRRFTQKWIQPPACSGHGLYGHKPQSFPKMPEKLQLFFGLRLVSRIFQHPAIQTKWSIPLAEFSTNKSVLANRKKGFYTYRDPNKQEVGFIFVWSGSELWSLSNYSKLKYKKSISYSGWCPFQGLSNGITLMQIQSGRSVPLSLYSMISKWLIVYYELLHLYTELLNLEFKVSCCICIRENFNRDFWTVEHNKYYIFGLQLAPSVCCVFFSAPCMVKI